MPEKISTLSTPQLIREAARLERLLIAGTSSAIETEQYCLIQLELGGRIAHEIVLDPRD